MSTAPSTRRREVAGILATRAQFETTVQRLLDAGFDHADLSVLSSHDAIEAASGREGRPWRDVLMALVGDLKYEGPLVSAGLIALAAGPVGATVAGLVAAGVGGAAIKELLDEVTARPESEDFARALEAGSIILWVHAADDGREASATAVLTEAGAENVHTVERAVGRD